MSGVVCWVSKNDCMLVPDYKVTNPLVYGDPKYASCPDQMVPLYSQATVDTLRAQLEAAEAFHREVVAAKNIEITEAHEAHARCRERTKSAEARAEAAEAECARWKQVDADMVSRVANALTLAGWDIDPDNNGTGYAELEAALIWARTKEQQA